MTQPVTFELTDGIGRITLNRPHASNALDLPFAEAFREAVDAASDDEVRVVLLLGAGARFCAGGDVRSFRDSEDPPGYLLHLATVTEAELRRLSELPKPVIAGAHGAVAGAGLAFVLNADVVVAGRSTKFLTAYSGIGLTPDCGVSYLLPRAVGMQRALDLALTGRALTGEQALEWGIVSEVVDDDQVQARAEELARTLAGGATWALGQAKRLIRASVEDSREASAADEAATIATAVTTAESQKRVARFLDR